MILKKVIATALIATFALTTVAYGEPIKEKAAEVTKEKITTVSCIAATAADKADMKEISGKIETLTKNDMTVKTEDGKLYRVILGLFEKQTGYNDLRLAVGTTVKIKGAELVITTLPINEGDIKNWSSKEGNAEFSITVSAPEKVNVTDLKDLKQGDVGVAVLCTDAIPANVVTADVMAGKATFEGRNENIGMEITPLTKMADGEKMFFAEEITANGKTLKVNP